jgi:hypothetical protein
VHFGCFMDGGAYTGIYSSLRFSTHRMRSYGLIEEVWIKYINPHPVAICTSVLQCKHVRHQALRHEGKEEREMSVGTNISSPEGSRSTLSVLLLARVRVCIRARRPELRRAARERACAMQRARVSRETWRPVAKLCGIFERACIGSPRRWMASGGDGGGAHDEKWVPRPLQPRVSLYRDRVPCGRRGD